MARSHEGSRRNPRRALLLFGTFLILVGSLTYLAISRTDIQRRSGKATIDCAAWSATQAKPSQTHPTIDLPVLTVLVHFAQPMVVPGISNDEVTAKLQADLAEELGERVRISVGKTESNFLSILDAVREELYRKHGVGVAEANLARLARQYENRRDPPSIEFRAAQSDYQEALRRVAREVGSRTNWAQMPRGTVGLSIQPTKTYGGKTFKGERWSTIHTGVLTAVFPTPDELKDRVPAGLDYSSPAFEPYRYSYDEQVRKDYMLHYVANVAKQQIGLQFGLAPQEEGHPCNPMTVVVNIPEAEHFVRDKVPIHYLPRDRNDLISGIVRWIGERP